jgi:hypothetical protein
MIQNVLVVCKQSISNSYYLSLASDLIGSYHFILVLKSYLAYVLRVQAMAVLD